MPCFPKQPEMFEAVVIAMLMELFSGIIATVSTAFHKHEVVDIWPYILFGTYLTFVIGIIGCVAVEICHLKQNRNPKFSVVDMWLVEACTFVTFGVIVAGIFYSVKKLGQPLWTDVWLVMSIYVFCFAIFFLCYNYIASSLCSSRYSVVVHDSGQFASTSGHGKWI